MKHLLRWALGALTIEATTKYNYLGVWLTDGRFPSVYLNQLKTIGRAVIHTLNRIFRSLPSPTADPILKVTKAKQLPAVGYGQLAYPRHIAAVIEDSVHSLQNLLRDCPLGQTSQAES